MINGDDYEKAKADYLNPNNNYSLIKLSEKYNINRKELSRLLKKDSIEVKNNNVSNNDESLIRIKALMQDGDSLTKACKTLGLNKKKFSSLLGTYKPESIEFFTVQDELVKDYKENELSLREMKKKYKDQYGISVDISTIKRWLNYFGVDTSININKPKRTYNFNQNIFDEIDTPEKGYWLGILYSDGYVTDKNKYEAELSLKDKRHIEDFKNWIEGDMPIKDKITKLNGKTFTSYSIHLYSKKFVENLIAKGCTPVKSLNLTFPNESILPKQYIPHFVRGIFDGDGGVYNYDGNSEIGLTGTKNIIENSFKALNLNIGTYKEAGKAFTLDSRGNSLVYSIFKIIYKDASYYIRSKYEKHLENSALIRDVLLLFMQGYDIEQINVKTSVKKEDVIRILKEKGIINLDIDRSMNLSRWNTSEGMYFLGYACANLYRHYGVFRDYSLLCLSSQDEEEEVMVQKFADFFDIKVQPVHIPLTRARNRKSVKEIYISNIELINLLLSPGVFNSKYVNSFILGYFDYCGNVFTEVIDIIGNENILHNIKSELNQKDISGFYAKYNGECNEKYRIKGHLQRIKFFHYLYDHCDLHLEKKYEKFKLILNEGGK